MVLNMSYKLKSLSLIALSCSVLLGVTGCAKRTQSQDVTGSIAMEPDYRERHPIVLADVPYNLDIYAVHGFSGIDLRQNDDVRAFAAEYKTSGKGAIIISVPHAQSAKNKNETLSSIRKVLAAAGVSGYYVQVKHYLPQDLHDAAPVHLSFIKLQAKVDNLCGQWKTDISGAATSERFTNQSPPNFGCAYQTAIAAQVANPLDLDRPRQEGAIDVEKRNKSIKNLNAGTDPTTLYKETSSKIGSTQ